MASTLKVDTITTPDGTGNITTERPLAGSGAGLTSLPAANISGVIPAANLGTGTASASTFLNGSGAYSEAGGGATTLIARNTFTNASTIEITSGFDSSTYDSYLLMVNCSSVNLNSNAAMMGIRTSSDGGSSFDSTSGHYRHAGNYTSTSSTNAGHYSNSAHYIPFDVSNLTATGAQLELVILRPDITSTYTTLMIRSSHIDASGYLISFEASGQRLSNGLVNGIQLMQFGSMLITGTYQFIGYKKA